MPSLRSQLLEEYFIDWKMVCVHYSNRPDKPCNSRCIDSGIFRYWSDGWNQSGNYNRIAFEPNGILRTQFRSLHATKNKRMRLCVRCSSRLIKIRCVQAIWNVCYLYTNVRWYDCNALPCYSAGCRCQWQIKVLLKAKWKWEKHFWLAGGVRAERVGCRVK